METSALTKIPTQETSSKFIVDIKTIRDRARQEMQEGANTASYGLDKNAAINVLNQALATELVCMLRYRQHSSVATGPNSEPIAKEFLAHANEELSHADRIAKRIVQLGGSPDFNPQNLSDTSHADYVAGQSLEQMIKENLVAERIAIDVYREMVRWFGERDPSTRRMIESILSVEEEHADELLDLLEV